MVFGTSHPSNWFHANPTATSDQRSRVLGSYADLVKRHLGFAVILCYAPEHGFEGAWSCLVTDAQRIGRVEGCYRDGFKDELYRVSPKGPAKLARELLESVRTFISWEDVQTYIESFNDFYRDPCSGDLLQVSRQELDELEVFARAGLPLDAVDIFLQLQEGTPGTNVVSLIEAARLVRPARPQDACAPTSIRVL